MVVVVVVYISSVKPSQQLVTLATFVMKVYSPVWFHIKTSSSCTEGPRHLHRMIAFSQYLPKEMRAIVDPVIQRNAFFGHPKCSACHVN